VLYPRNPCRRFVERFADTDSSAPGELAAERRTLIPGLFADGFSQADSAREIGVSRPAVPKMLAG
jgi:CRP-like cAMP-binding protein